jgi:hypothetical protein
MPLESSTTDTVIKHARALGCIVEKTHGGHYGEVARPDLYILVPVPGSFAVPLRIEMKQAHKKLRQLQAKRLRDYHRRGVVVLAKPTVDEVIACIRSLQAGANVGAFGLPASLNIPDLPEEK